MPRNRYDRDRRARECDFIAVLSLQGFRPQAVAPPGLQAGHGMKCSGAHRTWGAEEL